MKHFIKSVIKPFTLSTLLLFSTSCQLPLPVPIEKFSSGSIKNFTGVTNNTDVELRVYSGGLDNKVVVHAPPQFTKNLSIDYQNNMLVFDTGDYCMETILTTKTNSKNNTNRPAVKEFLTPVQKAKSKQNSSPKCEKMRTEQPPYIEVFSPGVDTIINTGTGGIMSEYISTSLLKIQNSGSGNILFTRQIIAQAMEIQSTSSGNVSFTSKVNVPVLSLTIVMDNNGSVNAASVPAKNAKILQTGNGNLTMQVKDSITGKINGNGKLILVDGNPKIDELIVVGLNKIITEKRL